MGKLAKRLGFQRIIELQWWGDFWVWRLEG
jgi:hypothetical protein